MTRRWDCSRESDVVDAVAVGVWPDRAADELVAHVNTCDVCRDLVIVTRAIADLADVDQHPVLPDATMVWYRSQLRARHEAARRAARPLHIALISGAAALAATATAWGTGLSDLVWQSTTAVPRIWQTLSLSTQELVTATASRVLALADLPPTLRWIAIGGLAATILTVPAAVWLSRIVDSDT